MCNITVTANTYARATATGPMGRAVDFSLADFNTVTLLTPVTDAATAWVANHLPHNLIRWGGGIAIETRDVEVVMHDINESGLLVETYVSGMK